MFIVSLCVESLHETLHRRAHHVNINIITKLSKTRIENKIIKFKSQFLRERLSTKRDQLLYQTKSQ